MFAIVKIAGKQHIAEVGKRIKIDSKIEAKDNKTKITEVLLISDDKDLKIGKPTVDNAFVEAEVIDESKAKKVLVVKHHPKKRYRRVVGHRQDSTTLLVTKINEKQ